MPAKLPSRVERILHGRERTAVQIGMSNAEVYRYDGGLYLKSVKRRTNDLYYGNLEVERVRLEWLKGKVAVPEVVAFEADDECDYLVITEMPGVDAAALVQSPIAQQRAVESIAAACRALHNIDVGSCPWVASSQDLIDDARIRLDAGLVDCDDFDDERIGRDPYELLRELIERKPMHDDLVLTHGDLCLPNIILQSGQVSGLIDVGRLAVSDRWRDLALCARSMASNWSNDAALRFLEVYGATAEPAKHEFYVLLDEFF